MDGIEVDDFDRWKLSVAGFAGRSYGFVRTRGVCFCLTAPASETDCTLSASDGTGDCALDEAALARPCSLRGRGTAGCIPIDAILGLVMSVL